MQNYAAGYGGKCLSEKYEGISKKLLWECGEGHQWKMPFSEIKKDGVWCRKCKDIKERQEKLDKLKAFAINHEGKCLTKEYLGSQTKIEFECAKGHHWTVLSRDILRNKSWCPYCSGRFKKS